MKLKNQDYLYNKIIMNILYTVRKVLFVSFFLHSSGAPAQDESWSPRLGASKHLGPPASASIP